MIKFASRDIAPRGEYTNDEFRANPSNQHKPPGVERVMARVKTKIGIFKHFVYVG
jgi:hypothetical protein